jgi:RNA polymerase sigma-70 factor (ECF subfamily)
MDTTSVSLLRRLQRPQDAAAWDRFVALYRPLFCTWARQLRVPAADVDDLVQEVLAALLVKLPRFERRTDGSFRGWLWTVTRHKWLELQRRRPLPAAGAGPDLTTVEGPDHAEQVCDQEFRERLLARALALIKNDFPGKTWQAFWEVTVAGKAPAEVAAALGLTVGAVHAARFRVLGRLRQDLADMLDDN